MDKSILQDYIDACELIKETEDDIRKLRRKKKMIISTNVKGSNQNFPYQEQHFRVQGTTFSYLDDRQLRIEEQLLTERKANADNIKIQVESWMNTIPNRMQRIIRFKIFNGESWEEVARKMGRKSTGDSIRMEFDRFMKEK